MVQLRASTASLVRRYIRRTRSIVQPITPYYTVFIFDYEVEEVVIA